MIRTKHLRQVVIQSFLPIVIICLILLSLGLQANSVSAYQSDTITPSLTLEFIVTQPTEETLPTFTSTATMILTAETTGKTSSPIPWDTATSTNSITPTSITSSPIPTLPGEYWANQVLVRFKQSVSHESILQCLAVTNAIILDSIEELSIQVVEIPYGKVAESIVAISNCPEVRYAEPNYMASIADTIPSDPNSNLQYGLINIRAPQGWDYSTGSSAVTIAIVDSGVDLGHADLIDKIVPGYDFVNNDPIAQDDNGHGTHVAGIAAASANNGIGVAGVSWGARIMPVKVLNAGGGGSFANVAAGIIWAADNGAQVINLSLGGGSSSAVLQDAVNYAYGKGVVLVAAVGNTGSGVILYPASYPNVIAVGAVDSTNNHAGFSNYGPELDLVAPGASIYSTTMGGYGYNSGTSMAASYVSGLAAILRGYPAGYSPDAIAFEMESTALDLGSTGFDNFYGYGLIQMDSALQFSPIPTSTLTASPTYLPVLIATRLPTLTPASLTATALTPTLTLSPTFLPSTTPAIEISGTPEVIALEILGPAKTNANTNPNWLLPSCGVLLILLGIILFGMAYHQQNKNRKGRLQF